MSFLEPFRRPVTFISYHRPSPVRRASRGSMFSLPTVWWMPIRNCKNEAIIVSYWLGLRCLSTFCNCSTWKNGMLATIAAKVVGYVLFGGIDDKNENVFTMIKSQFSLVTVVYGSARSLFYGLKFEQDYDMETTIDINRKRIFLESYRITRARRKCVHNRLVFSKHKSFNSLNGSLAQIGALLSQLYAIYSSHLQPRASFAIVEGLIVQIISLQALKRSGTAVNFTQSPQNILLRSPVDAFSDAARILDHGQTSTFAGLIIGELYKESVYPILFFFMHKYTHPVKAVGQSRFLPQVRR